MRADVTHGSTILANRSTPAERAASKADTHWTDTFERFHPDCREMFEANPSRHGVDRRLSFDDKAENSFWTGPKKGNLASPDAVVRELPPMPLGAPRWAREIWAAQGGGAKI